MTRWIAYEYEDSGWPTHAYLIVDADTQADARRAMARAIAAQSTGCPPPLRARFSALFIEDPRELPEDDPRSPPAGVEEPIFRGFGEAPR